MQSFSTKKRRRWSLSRISLKRNCFSFAILEISSSCITLDGYSSASFLKLLLVSKLSKQAETIGLLLFLLIDIFGTEPICSLVPSEIVVQVLKTLSSLFSFAYNSEKYSASFIKFYMVFYLIIVSFLQYSWCFSSATSFLKSRFARQNGLTKSISLTISLSVFYLFYSS